MASCGDATPPEQRAAAPAPPPMRYAEIAPPGCADECTITLSGSTFRLPETAMDSAHVLRPLARATIAGNTGMVRLTAAIDPVLQAALNDTLSIFAIVGGDTTRIPLADLLDTATVFQFTAADTVSIGYFYYRRALPSDPDGTLQLTQLLTPGQALLATTFPGSGGSGMRLLGTMCDVYASPASCDAVSYSFDATVYSTNPFGATNGLSTTPGSSASDPLTITFTEAVRNVSVKIYDATWTGNAVQFYYGYSPAGSGYFLGSQQPGEYFIQTEYATGDVTRINLIPAADDYVVWEVAFETIDGGGGGGDPPPPVAYIVSCTPGSVTRGQTVQCKVTAKNATTNAPVAFTVTSRSSTSTSIRTSPYTESTGWAMGPGDTHTWSGLGVAQSNVTFNVRAFDKDSAVTASFAVANRTGWTPLMPILPAITQYAYDPDGRLPDTLGNPGGDILAYHHPGYPNFSQGLPTQVATGPNKGLSYFSQRPGNPQPRIYIHPYLQSGSAWHSRQTGPPPALSCDGAGAERWRSEVARHEGVSAAANSHVGITVTVYPTVSTQTWFDSLVVNGSTLDLEDVAKARWIAQYVALVKAPHQDTFDIADYPRVEATAGCTYRP